MAVFFTSSLSASVDYFCLSRSPSLPPFCYRSLLFESSSTTICVLTSWLRLPRSTDAPEVELTVDKAEIHEQDTVQFHCKTTAYPEPMSINWYRNDEPIKADEGQDVLELAKVSRKANGDTISCEVRNAVGVNRSTVALNVIYKPQFKTNDKPVMAVVGTLSGQLPSNN